ncbi:unnamed protein product [Acanthoscelides obtectus]|uniref:Uncharacterized protein n=1 Tax=Acanthoscelides obtectus TaxID=200917 RepID=A0A9P0PYL1_ACAOB|nr:unnamed protein product [Acanthoscelides obtectus]CAK1678173.1 hypothetical protein AOBTE_LOCUS31773 [Acanthoscelides obtectus]
MTSVHLSGPKNPCFSNHHYVLSIRYFCCSTNSLPEVVGLDEEPKNTVTSAHVSMTSY